MAQRKQEFLLTFFPNDDVYREIWINGYWLIKQWNGNNKSWQVAIFTEDSYKNYKKRA